MKLLLTVAAIVVTAISAEARDPFYSATPESRYWALRAAGNYGQAAVNVGRRNFGGAARNFYYGARNEGRALYFGSRDFRRNRNMILRSPDWDARRRYFRR